MVFRVAGLELKKRVIFFRVAGLDRKKGVMLFRAAGLDLKKGVRIFRVAGLDRIKGCGVAIRNACPSLLEFGAEGPAVGLDIGGECGGRHPAEQK